MKVLSWGFLLAVLETDPLLLHAQDAAVLALLASSVVGAACLWPPLRQPAADPAVESSED